MEKQGKEDKFLSSVHTTGEVMSSSDIKSFYYPLTLKMDNEIKLFNEAKKVTRDDIINLNEQVQSKLKNYRLLTNQVTINVFLSGHKICDFGMWKEFSERKWTTPSYTKSVSIKWDFHVQFPDFKKPQLHTIKLRLGSKIRPAELMEVIMLNDDDVELAESVAYGVCKVDFINTILATELLQLVSDWYEVLPNADDRSKLQKFIEENTSLVVEFAKLSLHVTTILITLFVLKYLYNINYLTQTSIRDTKIVMLISFSLILILLLSNFAGEAFSHYFFYHKIRKFKSYTMFNLTKGDENRNSTVKTKNTGILKDLTYKILGTVAADIIMGIVHFFYRV